MKCYVHKDKESRGFCKECSKPFCESCLKVEGELAIPLCFRCKPLVQLATREERKWNIALATLGFALFTIYSYAIFVRHLNLSSDVANALFPSAGLGLLFLGIARLKANK